MSTISSNADLSTKYHRVATEYAKLKAQIPVLKNAVLDEKAKTKRLTEEMHVKESSLRKLEAENESLSFRNGQLVKRVESLQSDIDQTHQNPSAKKRHAPSPNSNRKIDSSLLEDEFMEKVRENERLHSKVFELESMREQDTMSWSDKCLALERENDALKSQMEKLLIPSETPPIRPLNIRNGPTKCERISECENEMAGVSGEGLSIEDVEETSHVLVIDTLRSARSLISGFAGLLRLLEQRSTIYPNDMNIERLPENTILYGTRLVKSGDMLDKVVCKLDDLTSEISEDESISITDRCDVLAVMIAEAFDSTKAWKELFAEGIRQENRLSWAGPNLCKCNEEWIVALFGLLDHFLVISGTFRDQTNDSSVDVHTFIEPFNRLTGILKECTHAYSSKLLDENRLPTASKRLRCVNECIDKCLLSLSKNSNNISSLIGLVAGTADAPRSRALSAVRNVPGSDAETTTVVKSNGPVVNGKECLKEEFDSVDRFAQGDQKESTSEVGESQTTPTDSSIEFLKQQLACASTRVLELEKEKERIIVEGELLKMKLNTVSSDISNGLMEESQRDELEMLGVYYEKRVDELLSELQMARSQACYYKSECEDLLRKTRLVVSEKESMSEKLTGADRQIASLNEDLETTRKGYEDQMRNLYEHLGELNSRIENQTDTITTLRDTSRSNNGLPRQGSRKLLFK